MLKNINIKKTFWIVYHWFSYLGKQMGEHRTFILAGGLSFNILLYIIPLTLISIFIVNLFLPPRELIDIIQNSLLHYLPITEENNSFYVDLINGIIAEIQNLSRSSKVAGIVGFAVLLWISSSIVSTINSCISLIFNIIQPDYFKTKLKDLAMTILLNVLILIYCFVLPIFNAATSLIDSLFPNFISEFTNNISLPQLIIQWIVSFILFYFIYWIIPSGKTKRQHFIAIRATLFAVVATEAARFLFVWYISTISNYSRFYGTYAFLVTMAVWLYYSCFIILFSAELSKYIWETKQKKLALANEKLISKNIIKKKINYNNRKKKR